MHMSKQPSSDRHNNFMKKNSETTRNAGAHTNSPDSLQAKFSGQFGFLEDDDIFFSQTAEHTKRTKAKTDYRRRESNVSDQANTPGQTSDTPATRAVEVMQGPEVIQEQSIEETSKDC